MESNHGLETAHWDHEPRNRKSLEINGTIARFMERNDARNFPRWNPEPLSEEDRKRPSSRPSPGGRRRTRTAGFGGLGPVKFVERNDARGFPPWDPEPLSDEDRERPSSRPSPGGRRRTRTAGFGGLGEGFAGIGFDGYGNGSWRGTGLTILRNEEAGLDSPLRLSIRNGA